MTMNQDPKPTCDPGYCVLDGKPDGNGEPMGECPAGYCYEANQPSAAAMLVPPLQEIEPHEGLTWCPLCGRAVTFGRKTTPRVIAAGSPRCEGTMDIVRYPLKAPQR